MTKHWDIDTEKTVDHWLEVMGKEEYGDRWWGGRAKWDGCVQINRAFNVPFPITHEHPQGVDGLHICDLDEFIEMLLELREMGRKHFNNEYWTPKEN